MFAAWKREWVCFARVFLQPLCVCVHVCVHVCVCVCMFARVFVFACAHAFVYFFINWSGTAQARSAIASIAFDSLVPGYIWAGTVDGDIILFR